LMSQLASIQQSLMATALYGSVPSSLGVPSTVSQSDDSAIHGVFTSQRSDRDEYPCNR